MIYILFIILRFLVDKDRLIQKICVLGGKCQRENNFLTEEELFPVSKGLAVWPSMVILLVVFRVVFARKVDKIIAIVVILGEIFHYSTCALRFCQQTN